MKKNIILPILFLLALTLDVGAQQWTGTTDINHSGGNVGINTGSPLVKLHITGTGSYNSFVAGDMKTTSATFLGNASSYLGFNLINTAANQWTSNSNGSRNGGAGIFATHLGELSFVAASTGGTETQPFVRTDSDINQNVHFKLAPWAAVMKPKFNRGDDYRMTTISAVSTNNREAHGYANGYIGFNVEDSGDSWYIRGDGGHNGGAAIISNIMGELKFYTVPTESASSHLINNAQFMSNEALMITPVFIATNRKVQIGAAGIPTDHKLSVAGKIIAEEVTVSLVANWPDYVFDKTYTLPSLRSVDSFIKENGHLPEMPSAAEVSKNGIDLGSTNASLLKKIEELTLYVIELEKVNDEQSKVLKQVLERLDKEK